MTDSGESLADENLEKAISDCVRLFYARAGDDPLLGPVFAAAIPDLEGHLKIIIDFWSRALLRTTRYSGHPYPLHVPLAIGPEHFDRWVALFEQACRETLPQSLSDDAIGKARHMSASFQAGMFPFRTADGEPSRFPPA